MAPRRSTMIGRTYLDPGDALSGRYDPPQPVVILLGWGSSGGPRNVLVRRPDGTRQVIPFFRRLRRPTPDTITAAPGPHSNGDTP